jgi:3-dehydroquinate synthase
VNDLIQNNTLLFCDDRHPKSLPSKNVNFNVPFTIRIRSSQNLFSSDFGILENLFERSNETLPKVQAWIDSGVLKFSPEKVESINNLLSNSASIDYRGFHPTPGGEDSKMNNRIIEEMWNSFNIDDLDRRSYILAIGGGATLDSVGYAAALAHRGIRIIRVPATTLSQADSGVGVKNAINHFGKKNWLGSFSVPWGVINDYGILESLSDRDFYCGFSEALKVFLLKSPEKFSWLCAHACDINKRNPGICKEAITQSVLYHLDHITKGGDPFESETARPLDFGHWSAHKLEPLSKYEIRHGEAVAIGVALDCIYSSKVHGLDTDHCYKAVKCLADIGLPTFHPLMKNTQEILVGLEEFRQHLGGILTITLIESPGHPINVHSISQNIMRDSINELESLSKELGSSL